MIAPELLVDITSKEVQIKLYTYLESCELG